MGKNNTGTVLHKKNEIVRIEITDISTEGMGVGKSDGYTLFVKDAIPGDIIDARIVKVKKNYGYGRVEKIIEPSPARISPRCTFARQCGGCQLQEMEYARQLGFKQDKVRNALVRLGGFNEELIDNIMEPIIGMEEPWRYRNKAQYPVGTDKAGDPVAGFYAGRTHDIIGNTDCLLGVPENKTILETILAHMKKYRVPVYDEKLTGNAAALSGYKGAEKKGTTKKAPLHEKDRSCMIRHVLIRKGFASGEIMVCIVIKTGDVGSVNKLKIYIPGQQELISELGKINGVCSISVNINNKDTNVILGEETHTLWGSERIRDTLLGKIFEISPLSFYQVNPVQTEKLYSTAIEFAGLTGSEEVWDICCGIGTISLCMADRARLVHGLEIVPEAIEDAKKNAALNNIHNAEFICAAAEEYLPAHKDEIKADVIVLDPPRKGMDEAALAVIADTAPERIVYVSCDPATLARDLKYLTAHGYELTRVRPCEMFAQTVHIETCVLLTNASKSI